MSAGTLRRLWLSFCGLMPAVIGQAGMAYFGRGAALFAVGAWTLGGLSVWLWLILRRLHD
jgi:hypothetical protein